MKLKKRNLRNSRFTNSLLTVAVDDGDIES